MTPREAFSTLLQSVAAEGLSPRLNQEWAAQSGVMGVASKQPRQLAAAYIAVRIWLDWCHGWTQEDPLDDDHAYVVVLSAACIWMANLGAEPPHHPWFQGLCDMGYFIHDSGFLSQFLMQSAATEVVL